MIRLLYEFSAIQCVCFKNKIQYILIQPLEPGERGEGGMKAR